ncbi:hypothetical protein JA9_004184 [Meyerozyma sp. JA9]|nr:hypothetical protein JA9_004184 [Meyerozyma sp. JA9]
MVGPPQFSSLSPFNVNDASSYNVDNTTPELLKFQLQESYRSKLKDLASDLPSLNILHSHVLQGAFNGHLQSSIESGQVQLRESVPSLSSTPGSDSDTEARSPVSEVEESPNYLNLKILIENSVFDTSKVNKDAILSLSSLKALKQSLQEQKELKHFLSSKYNVSQQFLRTMITNSDSSDIELEPGILLRLIKSTSELSQQLVDTSERVDSMNSILNNHNLACLVLGYVEDVKLSSLNGTTASMNSTGSPAGPANKERTPYKNPELLENASRSFDSLFSHVASVAAQRGISLPPPPSPSSDNLDHIESRTNWTKTCIDAILQSPTSTPQPEGSAGDTTYANDTTLRNSNDGNLPNQYVSPGGSPSKSATGYVMSSAEYRTALNDLRFAHQYLAKEYELSKENSGKVIQDNRRKIDMLENELRKLRTGARDLTEDLDTTKAKDAEIARLKKEVSFLKIDRLGSNTASSPKRGTNLSPVSSFNTLGSSESAASIGAAETDDNANSSQLNSAFVARPSSFGNSTSTAILRKEFKKIISDIQDQYELELSEERIRRRKLSEEVKKLKSPSG